MMETACGICPHFDLLDSILSTKEANAPEITLQGGIGLVDSDEDENVDNDDEIVEPSLRTSFTQKQASQEATQQDNDEDSEIPPSHQPPSL